MQPIMKEQQKSKGKKSWVSRMIYGINLIIVSVSALIILIEPFSRVGIYIIAINIFTVIPLFFLVEILEGKRARKLLK